MKLNTKLTANILLQFGLGLERQIMFIILLHLIYNTIFYIQMSWLHSL